MELCPLRFTSNNAPSKQKIFGTVLLSILAGHKRYAHITTVRSGKVLPELPSIEGLASEDSVRRAFTHASGEELTLWLDRCMNTVFEPLLSEPWVLDVDATVKTLCGKQEEARIGYNPMKPGRPPHVYHAYRIARLRMPLNAGVQAGNQIASEYAHAGLWGWLDARPREQWPAMLRGDIAWGTEKTMCECEARGLPFLFKPRQTEGVVKHLVELPRRREWKFAGGGWRVVVLRGPLPEQSAGCETETPSGQKVLAGMAVWPKTQRLFEYEDVLWVAQQYRDRGDAGNIFDKLKNQWAWTGFTTHDLKRSQLMARIVALVFNWWSLWVRLAVTSRPALVYGVAKRTTHGNQSRVTITSCHGKVEVIAKLLDNVNRFLLRFTTAAEQLNRKQRWARPVRILLREFFPERAQEPAPLLC